MPTLAEQARDEFQQFKDYGRVQKWRMAEVCQADPNSFGEFCFGHTQQPLHERWNRIMDDYPRSVTWGPPEHGKTFHFAFVRFIWELGRNPHDMLLHVSAQSNVPFGTVTRAAWHIRYNERIHTVFPKLKIAKFGMDPARNWCIWLDRPGMHTDRDPSWTATGMKNPIHGRRSDGILLDDILDYDNTYTPTAREKTTGRVSNTIMGRISAEGWIRFIGYPFFPDDTAHWLAERKDWHFERYDVMNPDENGEDAPPGLWPEPTRDPQTGRLFGWPWKRILAKREDTEDLDWERQWRCRTPAKAMQTFPAVILKRACQKGRGLELGRPCPAGIIPVSGIDPSTGDGSDETVIATGYFAGGMLDVLDLRGGLWDDPTMYGQMRDLLRMYPMHGGFLLESNNFQRLMVRTLNRADTMQSFGWTNDDIMRCRVTGRVTGKEKHDSKVGIRSLQIDFKNERVRLPSDDDGRPWPEVRKLVRGLEQYDPNKKDKHTSDYVIAFWLMVEKMRKTGQISGRKPRI